MLISLLSRQEIPSFYLSGAGVRNGDSDLDSPEVCGPHRLIGPGRV